MEIEIGSKNSLDKIFAICNKDKLITIREYFGNYVEIQPDQIEQLRDFLTEVKKEK